MTSELDFDTSAERRQLKLKRPLYNLEKVDWEKLRKELIGLNH